MVKLENTVAETLFLLRSGLAKLVGSKQNVFAARWLNENKGSRMRIIIN